MMGVIYFFLGKIQRCFNRYAEIGERLHYDMYGVGKLPLQRAHGTTCGFTRTGIYDVRYAFSLSKVQLVVKIGTKGEFSGLRHSGTRREATG